MEMSIIEQNELSFINDKDIALNEIESNGFIYTRGKPSNESIKELRQQKKRLLESKKEEVITETIISPEIKEIQNTKGKERREIEERITSKVLEFFKNSQGFNKNELNFLFPIAEEKTKRRLTGAILKNMELMGKIKKTNITARYISLISRSQGSRDCASYELLKKNKRGCILDSPLSVSKKTETYTKSFYEIIN